MVLLVLIVWVMNLNLWSVKLEILGSLCGLIGVNVLLLVVAEA